MIHRANWGFFRTLDPFPSLSVSPFSLSICPLPASLSFLCFCNPIVTVPQLLRCESTFISVCGLTDYRQRDSPIHLLSSRSLSPDMAGRSRRSLSRSRSKSRSRSRSYDSADAENPGNNLYVTGLSTRVTKKELEKHFSSEGGTVLETHLVVDPRTRESRGFGFVTMSTNSEAGRCVKYLNRSVLGGRVITVEKAKRKRGRTPTPGRYLGVNTVRVRRRSPSYSPYGRSGYDSGRDRAYSPYSRRGRERYRSRSCSRESRSPYGSRHQSHSRGSGSPHARRRKSYSRDSRSPYEKRDYRDRRERSRSHSPYYRTERERSRFSDGRHERSISYERHRRSASRSLSPKQGSRKRRSPSRSLSPRSRIRSRSISSRSRS